jgi:hypothetical protein
MYVLHLAMLPSLTLAASFSSSLEELYLFDNNLIGTIPTQVGALRALQSLALELNKGLSGPLPSEVGRLNQLRHLWLHGCNLT